MRVRPTGLFARVRRGTACASCQCPLNQPLEGPVCEACWRAISRVGPPLCVRCGNTLAAESAGPWCPICARGRSIGVLIRSAGRYADPLRKILHAANAAKSRWLTARLAGLLLEAGRDLLRCADAVVPVPARPRAPWGRAVGRADDLVRHLGVPVARVLGRHGCGPIYVRARLARGLRNRAVILVDDVVSTGATIDACARALWAAGVRTVGALTVARAAPAPPGRRPLRPRPLAVPHR